MKTARIEQLTWALIYGGVIVLCLGWFIAPGAGPWGELMVGAGVVGAAVGAVLIFVRSRLPEQ
jgi:hypothetical protein